jgi:hypothetical protein
MICRIQHVCSCILPKPKKKPYEHQTFEASELLREVIEVLGCKLQLADPVILPTLESLYTHLWKVLEQDAASSRSAGYRMSNWIIVGSLTKLANSKVALGVVES